MFKSKNDIQTIVDEYCKSNKLDVNDFDISLSEAHEDSNGRIKDGCKVVNSDCKYAISYFINYNLFVIWDYKINHNKNYSLKTIKEKLSKNIFEADKGFSIHTNNQCKIHFCYGEDFKKILDIIHYHI